MIKRAFTPVLILNLMILGTLGASAKESVIIKSEKRIPVEERTTTTTTSPGDGVIISTPSGDAAIVAPSTTTTVESETRTGTPIVEKSVEIKKKKGNHHLLNVFGLFKVF